VKPQTPLTTIRAWAHRKKVAYSKGMATGLPARVVFVCAILASATIARADRRTVAVIDLSADPTAEALATELYAILTNHLDLQPINYTFIRPLKGAFADEDRPSIEAATRAKQEADKAYVDFDDRAAEAAAERGILALHHVRPTPEMLGLYAELAFSAGQAALRLRKPNDASLAFGLSYRLDQGKRPDPTRYMPEIVQAYKDASTKQASPATLEVKGSGTVWIDGVDRGPAPGTFDVSAGLHLVQLSGPERETRGQQVNVPATTMIEIEPAPASEERKVERARIELALSKDAASRAGAMKKLAGLLGVGDAVLIEMADGKLLVQTWRDRAPGFSGKVAYEEGKAGELLVPLAPPRKIEPPKKPDIVPPPVVIVDTPLVRKRWFQGAIAGGVIAIATTIILVATYEREITLMNDIKPAGE
jgi:hypothetical protein